MRHDTLSLLRWLAVTASFGLALAGCGGGGGGGGGGDEQPPDTVEVSGRITFDRIPFKPELAAGLDPSAIEKLPAREVAVQALAASSGAVLASATTDADGNYSLTVPTATQMKIRARAEMIKTGAAPTWDFSVHNNTNGDALYVLDGENFDSGTANQTRDLNAPSGWGTTSYTGTRAAAPFAILDTIYQAKQLILSAADSTEFPALDLFWSPDNRNTVGEFCPDEGDIGTSFYVGGGKIGDSATGNCSPDDELPAGIYILGDFASGAGDTDEFDPHVIAHEFGHYIEDRFSRSDSIGGEHQPGQRLDLRVAFGEGWGNAYSAMVLSDPLYRDSGDGVESDSGFDLDGDAQPEGWFSESSIGEILWDIFDGGGSADDDDVNLGFAPIFDAMIGGQSSTNALTSIFTFAAALRDSNGTSANAINALLAAEGISDSDEFGDAEDNDGGSSTALPIYTPIELNDAPRSICATATFGEINKLGYNRFLRLELTADATVSITVTGFVDPIVLGSVEASDPDIYVFRQGELVVSGQKPTPLGQHPPLETIPSLFLTQGIYILEVQDFELTAGDPAPHCMTVSVTGAT